MFTDSHCHLNYKGLVEEQAAVLDRARAAGGSTMLNLWTRERECDDVVGLAEREADVGAAVGGPPHEPAAATTPLTRAYRASLHGGR